MNLKRKKHKEYRGDWRMVISVKDAKRGYWSREEVTPPPYHPEKYFLIRNTYSRRTRGLIIKEQADSSYEVSTIVTYLERLWNEISPSPDDEVYFDWMEYLGKAMNEKVKRASRWGERHDIQTLLTNRLVEYFPKFDKEQNKHLILRILMLIGE